MKKPKAETKTDNTTTSVVSMVEVMVGNQLLYYIIIFDFSCSPISEYKVRERIWTAGSGTRTNADRTTARDADDGTTASASADADGTTPSADADGTDAMSGRMA